MPALAFALCLLAACSHGGAAADTQGEARRALDLPDGSSVEVPQHARRIVPASAGLVDFVTELVPPERLAGLPEQARRYSGRRLPGDPYLARPNFSAYTAESVLALRPDLVLCSRWQLADTAARLREAGVAVVLVDASERLPEIFDALRLVGRAVGEEQRAEECIAQLEQRVEALTVATAGRPARRALVYTNGGTGGWIATAGTTAHEFLRLAGLRDAGAEAGHEGHVRCDYEELLRLDPELLIMARPDAEGEQGGTARLVLGEPALAGLRAVRENGLIELPSWLFSSTSQHVVTAAEALVAQLRAREPATADESLR